MPTFDDVRSIAMRLPEVEERLTWGTDVTFRVRDKIFVIGADGSEAISLKTSALVQSDLVDLDPETFSPAPYVGRYGWVSVKLGRVKPPMLERLVRDAWHATAPRKLHTMVPDE